MVFVLCDCRNPDYLIEQTKNVLGFSPTGFSVNPSIWSQDSSNIHAHQSSAPVLDILEKCSDVDSPSADAKSLRRRRVSMDKQQLLEGRMFVGAKKSLGKGKQVECTHRRSDNKSFYNSKLPNVTTSESSVHVRHLAHEKQSRRLDVRFEEQKQSTHKESIMYKVVKNSALDSENVTRNENCESAKLSNRLVLRVKRVNASTSCSSKNVYMNFCCCLVLASACLHV